MWDAGVEGNQCYLLQTYSNWISKNIIKYFLSVFCHVCTDNQSCVLMFFSFPPFFHHCNPTDIWHELRSFEGLRYSRLHYSGQSLIVRFGRAILRQNDKSVTGSMRLERDETILFLYSWNITFVSNIPDLLNTWLDFAPSITLLGLDSPVLHRCLEG